MERISYRWVTLGVVVGFVIGFSLSGSHHPEPPPTGAGDSTEDNSSLLQEQALLVDSIVLMEQMNADLNVVRQQLQAMERTAKRYEWLKRNDVDNHRLYFNQYSFEPRADLMDFLDLDAAESERLRTAAQRTFEQVQAWELAHATCTWDSPTNCVYEIGALPDTIKQDFIRELENLLPTGDVEFLSPAVEQFFDPLEVKREVSLSFMRQIPYAEDPTRSENILELTVLNYDDAGNFSGSINSPIVASAAPWFETRWSHLFDLGDFE